MPCFVIKINAYSSIDVTVEGISTEVIAFFCQNASAPISMTLYEPTFEGILTEADYGAISNYEPNKIYIVEV